MDAIKRYGVDPEASVSTVYVWRPDMCDKQFFRAFSYRRRPCPAQSRVAEHGENDSARHAVSHTAGGT